MENTGPHRDISLSRQEERALGPDPYDRSHLLDLEVRVLAEILLDIYEFHQKKKPEDPREPSLDGIFTQHKI